MNDCRSSPCNNGGTCRDQMGVFTCLCPNGFEGYRCEIGGFASMI